MSKACVYLYPQLGGGDAWFCRIAGPGLGNMLFPWARAVALAHRHALPIIAPTWQQIKLGPLLRRETDPRFYHALFTNNGYIRGLHRLRLLATTRHVSEADFQPDLRNAIVALRGMCNYFEPIRHDWPLIWHELLRITDAPHKRALSYDFSNTISLHVRLGDQTSDANTPVYRRRIGIDWYMGMIETLRAALGWATHVHVFSDGTCQELAPLLALPGVSRLTFGSAIGDLLALARAEILVASGSTFSMWASYLGRMPVIWYPQQLRQRLYDNDLEVETTADGRLPGQFLNALDFRG